jgi:hypothetical protein
VQVGRATRLLPNNEIVSNKSILQQTGGKERAGQNFVGPTSSTAGKSSSGEDVSASWHVSKEERQKC